MKKNVKKNQIRLDRFMWTADDLKVVQPVKTEEPKKEKKEGKAK